MQAHIGLQQNLGVDKDNQYYAWVMAFTNCDPPVPANTGDLYEAAGATIAECLERLGENLDKAMLCKKER
jgi:hypothetical protein